LSFWVSRTRGHVSNHKVDANVNDRRPRVLTRQLLYERVWSEPTRKVAAGLGISDVGLAKVCRKFHIPRPWRGYWREKETGHRPRQPKLPTWPAHLGPEPHGIIAQRLHRLGVEHGRQRWLLHRVPHREPAKGRQLPTPLTERNRQRSRPKRHGSMVSVRSEEWPRSDRGRPEATSRPSPHPTVGGIRTFDAGELSAGHSACSEGDSARRDRG
jgi:hypothetical protein